MLYRAGLFDQYLPNDLNLYWFCNQLISQNPLLFEVIDDVRAEPESRDLVENVEELIHHCIPSEGDVELRYSAQGARIRQVEDDTYSRH